MYTPAFKHYVFQDKLSVREPNRYDIVSADAKNIERRALESFIHVGFANCYQADVQSFMPQLIGFKDNRLLKDVGASTYKAAMGFRCATSPLFVEQYLDQPIEDELASHGIEVERHQIAEIGNLYSASKRHTLPLLRLGLLLLSSQGIRFSTFTATRQVKAILQRQSVEFTHLAFAKPDKLIDQNECWGSYYQSIPEVLVIDIAKTLAATTVAETPLFAIPKTASTNEYQEVAYA